MAKLFFLITLLSTTVCLAQYTDAAGQTVDAALEAAASVGESTGAAVSSTAQGTAWDSICTEYPYACTIGAGLVVGAAENFLFASDVEGNQQKNTQGDGQNSCNDPLFAQFCSKDLANGSNGGPAYVPGKNDDPTKTRIEKKNTNIFPGGASNPLNALPPELALDIKKMEPKLKALGVDINDRDSIKAYSAKLKAEAAAGGDGGMQAALSSIPPEVQQKVNAMAKAKIAAYKAAFASFNGGGDGKDFYKKNFAGKDGKGKDLNLDDFMKKLQGDQNSRGPASVEGMSKSFGGETIGIASDNIFRMVTNRYQALQSRQQFLPVSNSRTPANVRRK